MWLADCLLIESTVLTSAVPTDGPLLLLMLNMLDNLTSTGVVSWDSIDVVHYVVEVFISVE